MSTRRIDDVGNPLAERLDEGSDRRSVVVSPALHERLAGHAVTATADFTPTRGQRRFLSSAIRGEQRRRRRGDEPADAAAQLAAEEKRERKRAQRLARG